MVDASLAKATVIQIGTGLDASANLIASGDLEQNYTITGPGGETTAIANVASGTWAANQATGQWITPVDPSTGTSSQNVGLYTYTRTIDGIGSLSGEFASDNGGELLVNGVVAVQTPGWENTTSGDYESFTSFSGISLSQAVNTIEFEVYNPSWPYYNPTGLIVAGTANVTPVPEPTTIVAGAMLLLPFGASTLRMFRKTRTA